MSYDKWSPGELAHIEFDALRAAHSRNSHREKMINTIVAIVDAELSGSGVTAVFSYPNTCSKNTYYEKWKHDHAFIICLNAIRRLASQWKDGEAGRALADAARRLALASPIAATTAVRNLKAFDPNVQLRAAFGILDRAGIETAVKSSQVVDNVGGLSLDEWREERRIKMQEQADLTDDAIDIIDIVDISSGMDIEDV